VNHDPHSALERTDDDPSAFPIVYAGLVGTLILILCVILISALTSSMESAQTRAKVYAAGVPELERLHAEQVQNIQRYRWIDRERGIVALPIDEAIRLVVRDGAQPATLPASAPHSGGP
jgi:hypothetical protein